jgi:hypothetical protein
VETSGLKSKTFASSHIEILLFVLLWVTYAYFYQSSGTNEAVRFDQIRALVHDRTLAIDRYCFNSPDLIRYPEKTGHVYPNKAPGMTLLGTIPFALVSITLAPFRAAGLPEWIYWHVVAYTTTVFAVGLLSALAAVATYRVLSRMAKDSYFAAVTVLAIWLGTLVFPYSTLFFSHIPTAALLVIAFYLLFELRDHSGTNSFRVVRVSVAGVLIGFSVAIEYPAVLLGAVLGSYVLWITWQLEASPRDKLKLLSLFASGLVIGGSALILYNLTAFGNAFYIPYETYSKPGASFYSTYGRGWMGWQWSGLGHFLDALLSLFIYRPSGLFYVVAGRWYLYACNPVLWLCLPGLAIMLWRRTLRPEGLLVGGMLVVYLAFIANYGTSMYDWGGGLYLGPRHLIPLLPFLTLPLYFGAHRLRWVFYPLAAISLFYMLLGTATEPRIAFPFGDIARDFLLPDYVTGHFGENAASLFGPAPNLTSDSTAANLPKLLHVPGHYQLVPLMICWVIGGVTLRFFANQKQQKFWGVGNVALFLFAGGIAAAPIIHHAMMGQPSGTRGLLGKYYRNATWHGEPAEVRIDRVIDFDWSKHTPYPAPFSVEWTGTIIVDREGLYMFTIGADDGALLEIDGKQVVDATHSLFQEKEQSISLTRGVHSIRVRYFNLLFGGSVKLWWTLLGRPRQILPNEVLVPASTIQAASSQ